MVEIKKILLPCDLTTNGSKIIPYVLSVAEKYNSTIYLLHVVEDLHELAPYPYPGLGNDQKIHEKASKKALLNKVGKMCDEVCDEHFQGCSDISKVIVVGHPVAEILKFQQPDVLQQLLC